MGRFRDNDGRSGFRGNRGRDQRFNNRESGFGGRKNFRDSGRAQMYDATCSKCGRQCQVPFRPTGSKPVLCSDCFRQQGDSGNNFAPRSQMNGSNAQAGISQEQFKQLNAKLDQILAILSQLEIEEVGDDDFEESDDSDDLDDEE